MCHNIKRIVNSVLVILGALLTIAECIHWMFLSEIIYELIHTYVFFVLLLTVLTSVYVNRAKLKYEYFLKNSDVKISLQVSDVLTRDAAIIIPTNTTFDTIMDDEFISVNSVQGQFQLKYFRNDLHTLDILLEKGLEEYRYQTLNRTKSKNKRYPLGTVSKITYDGKHFYFVAIADVNEYGKTINTKFENIQIALEGIWLQLENRGHIENLAIPLLGTGKAGIKEASRERVIKEIIFSFLACASQRKVTEKLLICVHPLDLQHKDLELEELNEYLQYMCKYKYSTTNNYSEGTPME